MPAEPIRAVLLSYASQDAEAARRICEALRAAGVEIWFDQSELRGGDARDAKIRKQIKECALFVPAEFRGVQRTRLPVRRAQGPRPDGDSVAKICGRGRSLPGGSAVNLTAAEGPKRGQVDRATAPAPSRPGRSASGAVAVTFRIP